MLGKKRAWERADEWLSAYIDGALSPRERARLEARLAQDPDLRARLESLQRTVALVRGLPSVSAPRNFLLTPAMVRQPAPTVRQPAPAVRRLAPALTFATAVSGLLCVLLLVGNLITSGWGGPGAAAPAPMIAYETGGSPQAQETQDALAKKAPLSPETVPSEAVIVTRAATVSETAVPEMGAWSEETPSPIEGPFPPEMGGVGEIGGIGGGGAEPGPSLREPGEPEEPESEVLPTPTPEPVPSVQVMAAGEETATAALPMVEVTPTSPPTEMPEREPAPPFTSWLPVGGLALLTVALAVLSIRAWRAR
ncbi:MAG: zf-HC2 domain-containing protein [Anaerolineae bacterium]|nr:zf-HC2 domain-containing protein [Anaerolineae bacterium]